MKKDEILLIAGMASVTFLSRYLMFGLLKRSSAPQSIVRPLSFVPAVVLTAIIVPSIIIPDGVNINVRYDNAFIFGGIAAVVIAHRRHNLLLTIIGGMLSFWLYRWIISFL
jgi:branched-subunit amino acid transport protein